MSFLARVGRLTRLTVFAAAFFSVWVPVAAVQVAHAASDTTPPACTLTAIIAGPPKQFQITVQDSDGGLSSIVITNATNASVSVPPFTAGTTSPVVVVATKIDQSTSFSVTLRSTDVAGNVSTCDESDAPPAGGGGGGGTGGNPPPSTTPELDSLLLFGGGLSGLGGYALMRLRARRRQ